MTTWTNKHALDIADKLHDVNYFLGLARSNVRNGHERKAADQVMAAIITKDRAVAFLPPVELANGDRLRFEELYVPFWTKDLLMYQAMNVASSTQDNGAALNPISIDWSHISRELRSTANRLRELLDRDWPANSPCKARLEALIQTLESAADFLRDNPPDKVDLGRLRDGTERLWREQVAFLECAYPDSPVSMKSMLGQFNAMNLWLINIYSALRTGSPPWGVTGQRRRHLLDQIETVESFKAVMLEWLEEAFPGTNAALDAWPAPEEPVPKPPGD